MINKITNNKISITIGIPIDKNQFASVRPVTIYPIRDTKAIVTAYVVSVLTYLFSYLWYLNVQIQLRLHLVL